jgi:hypothetical protein
VDDELVIFVTLAAGHTSYATSCFDGRNRMVAGLSSVCQQDRQKLAHQNRYSRCPSERMSDPPISQRLPKRQTRITMANVGSVRVNDFRTSIKVLTTPRP